MRHLQGARNMLVGFLTTLLLTAGAWWWRMQTRPPRRSRLTTSLHASRRQSRPKQAWSKKSKSSMRERNGSAR